MRLTTALRASGRDGKLGAAAVDVDVGVVVAVGDVVAVELVMVEAAGVDRAVPGERFSEQESL